MTPFENDVRKVMAEQFAHPAIIIAVALVAEALSNESYVN
jgi:hypothetical protein